MGKGKSSKPRKRTPKRKKRQIPEGLRRWNQVRSFISKENKKIGKKYNGVELNSLVKSFLGEYVFTSFSQGDLETYLKVEVPDFYSNALNVSSEKLGPWPYFSIDSAVRDLPPGLLVKVSAGEFGESKIKTSDYDYHESGLRDTVELIRLEAENDSLNYQFNGFVVPNSEKKKLEPDFLINFILFINGKPITGVPENVVEAPEGEFPDYKETAKESQEGPVEKANKKYKRSKELKEEFKNKKAKEKKVHEKSQRIKELELENENLRLKNERAKQILELIKAGFTKAEIKKMGL